MTDRPRPIIRGELVYLRPAERSDLPAFVRWLSDADVALHLAVRAPLSLALEEGWFERLLTSQGKTDYHFVICLRGDDRAIGMVGLHEIDFTNGNANFGIVIGEKDEWDQGFGTDATNAICDFGFGELRLERIFLYVYVDNDRGRRSYEKAGFSLEGTLRSAHFGRGERQDVHLMALLRSEWEAQSRPKSWERD